MLTTEIEQFKNYLKWLDIVWEKVFYFLPAKFPEVHFICFTDLSNNIWQVESQYLVEIRVCAWDKSTAIIDLKQKMETIISSIVWNYKNFNWFKVYQVDILESEPKWFYDQKLEIIRTFVFKKT